MSGETTTYSAVYMRNYARARPSTAPRGQSDKELADSIIAAMRALQDAMDNAVLAGLLVEPTITLVPNRFNEMGVSTESFILNVRIYRKLS
ncbi:MAG: hypothetical protein EXQ94_05605 [Alphaproteobacteria bacterium]|nr:hypothetical protein [Alphaproteobacteria bacterium]